MLVFSVLVFVSVSLAFGGVFLWLAPSRAARRVQALAAGAGQRAQWTDTVVKVTSPFAKLSTPEGDWDKSPLRVRFFNAGIRHPDARLVYFGLKSLLPLVFGGASLLLLRGLGQPYGLPLMLYVVIAAMVGCYLPNLVLSSMVRSRKREIFENFADAADLMLTCVEAGLGLDAALTKVAEEMRLESVPLAEELHLTNLELRAGATREQSLRNLALRTGVDEIGTFASMLIQADRFGTSIGESLRVFSTDLRHKRQIRAEELAAKVPIKMLFPLVLFVFPAIVMVVLGPAIIQIVRTVIPMISGQR
ncbi:MAG: type II secretion system F family protein [Ramlibacter sp.]